MGVTIKEAGKKALVYLSEIIMASFVGPPLLSYHKL
jgi:hypothetical protein